MTKKLNESTIVSNTLSFSDVATQMAELKAIIFNTPESEHAKLQLIKDELLSGRYQINSKHVADKLLEYAPVIEEVELV